MQGMVDCLYAKCIPCICDAVLAEFEKLGDKYRVALRIAKVREEGGNAASARIHTTRATADACPNSLPRPLPSPLSLITPLANRQDKRFERIPNPPGCQDSTYADDVIVEIAKQHRCYIVATCDRDLKRRIRKIPGVPIMFVHNHRYSVERLPEATVGGAPRF